MRIIQNIKLEVSAWLKLIISGWPDGPLGHRLRWRYWRRHALLHGQGNMARMANIIRPDLATIGVNFVCGEYAVVNPADSHGVYIGNNVMLGPRVYIRAADHNFSDKDVPINKQGHRFAAIRHGDKEYSIVIEDDVWIGANAVILSGAKIGKGTIIGAGSVVTNEIPPACIAVGSPARVVKMR